MNYCSFQRVDNADALFALILNERTSCIEFLRIKSHIVGSIFSWCLTSCQHCPSAEPTLGSATNRCFESVLQSRTDPRTATWLPHLLEIKTNSPIFWAYVQGAENRMKGKQKEASKKEGNAITKTFREEWINERASGRTKERTNERASKRMNERTEERSNGWTNERTNEQASERASVRTNEQTIRSFVLNERTNERTNQWMNLIIIN